MTLELSNDMTRPGGGYAVLRLAGSSLPNEIALEDRSSGLFLAEAGKWSKRPTYFKVDSVDANAVLLGPAIVDFMPSDTPVAVHAASGGVVGNVVWAAIRPSAGAASGDVLLDRLELDFAKAGADAISKSGPQGPTPPPPSTPLPPPSAPRVPPVVPAAAIAATPRNSALTKWLVIGGVLFLALAAFATLRNAEFAQRLVCNVDGSLNASGIARAVVTCPVVEAPNVPDQEEIAFNGFLKCLAGKPGCAQKVCADRYLSDFPSASHTADVNSAKREMDRTCQADADLMSSASDFAAFNECIRATAAACDRGGCVERYRNRLTAEPYVSSLRQTAQAASGECKRQREEAAFATFNECVSTNEACDTAKCARGFTSTFPNSNYVSRVLQIAENSARICATSRVAPQPPPQPPPQIQAPSADPVILPAALENEARNAGKGLADTLLYKDSTRANEIILECETRALTEKKIEMAIYCATFDSLVTTVHERLAREQSDYAIPSMNNREEMAARVSAIWSAAGFSKVPDDMTKATLTGLGAFNIEIRRINAKRVAEKARAEARRQPKCFLIFCN